MAKKNEGEMTFLEHLEEMRFVILKAMTVFVVALICVLIGFSYFNSLMLYPLNSAKEKLAAWSEITEDTKPVAEQRMGPVYLETQSDDGKTVKKEGPFFIVPKGDSIELFGADKQTKQGWYSDIKLRSMSFATPLIVYFYVGFLGALGISLPMLFYFAAQFIAPGLTKQELRMLKPGIFAAIALFAVGTCFAFFFILPMGIAFMSWLSQGMQMEMFPDAQSYYSMVIFVTIAIGVTFELPLLEFILIYLGVLNTDWLKKNRRMVFLIILIFASVVTPPDAITQISLTIPLYLMYEVALTMGIKARKRKLAREARAEKIAEAREERERREELAALAEKERLEAEKESAETPDIAKDDSTESIDKSHYSLPDDYDPNIVEEPSKEDYGYADYDNPDHDFNEEDYAIDSYINYGNLAKPAPIFTPDWSLNEPDVSFMAPNWDLNTESEKENSDDKKFAENGDKEEAETPQVQTSETETVQTENSAEQKENKADDDVEK